MYIGIVKEFDFKMGFGFVTEEKTADDIFVHITAFDKKKIRYLRAGTKVVFDIGNDCGKKMVKNLRLASPRKSLRR